MEGKTNKKNMGRIMKETDEYVLNSYELIKKDEQFYNELKKDTLKELENLKKILLYGESPGTEDREIVFVPKISEYLNKNTDVSTITGTFIPSLRIKKLIQIDVMKEQKKKAKTQTAKNNISSIDKKEHLKHYDVIDLFMPTDLTHKKLTKISLENYNVPLEWKEDSEIVESFALSHRPDFEMSRPIDKLDTSLLFRLYSFYETCEGEKKFTLASFVKKALNLKRAPAKKQLEEFKERIERMRHITFDLVYKDNKMKAMTSKYLLPLEWTQIEAHGKITREYSFISRPGLLEHIRELKQFTKVGFEHLAIEPIPQKQLPVLDFLIMRLQGNLGNLGKSKNGGNRILYQSYFAELEIGKRQEPTYKKYLLERLEEMVKTERIKSFTKDAKGVTITK